jgi:hypothetical protein
MKVNNGTEREGASYVFSIQRSARQTDGLLAGHEEQQNGNDHNAHGKDHWAVRRKGRDTINIFRCTRLKSNVIILSAGPGGQS